MDERSDGDKLEEIMLPGFRFHPTDEELVGFYLKRKIQQRPLSIQLIKQLDIYKYDPWDLPKLASTGEKEWYFYCPRDRKYRNSVRPNRVTRAGYWKATGTDRPIYCSDGSKCIGLKKSLVFYKGRAAKGTKTDWMMHEFRLPSLTDSAPPKRFMDKNNIPANESWAICRIFKKANSTIQRAPSVAWVSPILPETSTSDMLTQHSFISSLSPNLDLHPNRPLNQMDAVYTFLSPETSHGPTKSTADASSLLLNITSSIFDDFGKSLESLNYSYGMQEHYIHNGGFSISLPQEMQEHVGHGGGDFLVKNPNEPHFDEEWGINRSSIGFPFNFPVSVPDLWKSNLVLSYSSSCPSDQMSTSTYSTNKRDA